jgi:predicted transposase/invertase (TIGR01784 family)
MDDESAPHDRLHHLLFGHREVVEDLLRHIVRRLDFAGDGRWIDELDWTTLKREKETSTAEKLDRRFSDIVWSLSWRGSPLYLILLLEFQSRPDRFMALRQLTYLALFYEGLVKSGRVGAGKKLPAALPICLYNGEKAWRAPTSMDGLMAPCPTELQPFQPRFQYLLIEELKIEVDLAADERNAAGSVFAVQQADSRARLLTIFDAIRRWLPLSEYESLRRDIATLVGFVVPEQRQEIGDTLDLEEFMLRAKRLLTQEYEGDLAASRAEGRSEGRSEGRIEALRSVLAKQLRLKFGALPAGVETRLAQATGDQLEIWTERVLVASNLDEVLA